MPSTTKADSLRRLAFFQGLPDTLLWHLARAAEQRSLATDEILFRPGEPRTLLAVILKGTIAIEQQNDEGRAHISSFHAEEIIGEGILLDEGEHGTFARATEHTDLLVFRKDPLLKLLKDQPALYAALLSRAARILSDRIRTANAALLGVKMDATRVRAEIDKWIDAVTELVPHVGCDQALARARDALHSGRTAREFTEEFKIPD